MSDTSTGSLDELKVEELKELAAGAGIDVTGLKKAEIIEALQNAGLDTGAASSAVAESSGGAEETGAFVIVDEAGRTFSPYAYEGVQVDFTDGKATVGNKAILDYFLEIPGYTAG